MIRSKLSRIKKRLVNTLFPKKDYLNKGERYDPNLAKHYDQCHVSRYEFAMSRINHDHEVIDIACGTGWGSSMLIDKCKVITGVDISSDAIECANKKYRKKNMRFVQSDFFAYSGIGDVVVSFETLEHLQASSFEEVLAKLYSLSRNLIIGSVPFEEAPGNNPFHVSFQLNEKNFSFLQSRGKLSFLYQDSVGVIHSNKELVKPQNLIFIFTGLPEK